MVNENFSKMAQFISELRKEKKLTQKDLAKQLGVTDKAVSKWERGLGCPDISLLSKLSQVLGVTASELLNGKKTESSAPQVEDMVKTTLEYADVTTKTAIVKGFKWKHVAVISIILILCIFVYIGCHAAINEGLSWCVLPIRIILFIWLTALFIAFVMGKNKISSLLLCGFFVFIATFYYSALNQTPIRNVSTFNGFTNDYLPHYTIILIMFVISIALMVISFCIKDKKISGDKFFLLVAASIAIIMLSALTEPAMINYVDINGFGIDGRFSILLLLTLLISCASLALLAKHQKWQIADKQTKDND
ncbi:MAG: helix-turn-helix transcriptional regulator [Clostridiales bacterium]|nr:helix-turn-helix transcriptional regulator [Clostridiales bacterium]